MAFHRSSELVGDENWTAKCEHAFKSHIRKQRGQMFVDEAWRLMWPAFWKLLVQSPNLISGAKSIVEHSMTAGLGKRFFSHIIPHIPQCHVLASSPSEKQEICRGCWCWLRPSPPAETVLLLSIASDISGDRTKMSLDNSGAVGALLDFLFHNFWCVYHSEIGFPEITCFLSFFSSPLDSCQRNCWWRCPL